MSCQWREKVALFVDDELGAGEQEKFTAHLATCAECPAAIGEQMALKKSLRVAGSKYTAPPELRAAIYTSLHPSRSVSPWWKWATAPVAALLLATIGWQFAAQPRRADSIVAGLVDQHITALASEHPVDIVNNNQHVVKPWFAGKLPFTFNLPALEGSPFTLVGGKLTYAGQSPGAELIYTAGLHKISVFIFQARDAGQNGMLNRLSFNVDRWSQDGLQYYLVTDANRDEAGKLVDLFQQANK